MTVPNLFLIALFIQFHCDPLRRLELDIPPEDYSDVFPMQAFRKQQLHRGLHFQESVTCAQERLPLVFSPVWVYINEKKVLSAKRKSGVSPAQSRYCNRCGTRRDPLRKREGFCA